MVDLLFVALHKYPLFWYLVAGDLLQNWSQGRKQNVVLQYIAYK